MAIMAAQEVAEAPQTAVEAEPLSGQDEEMMVVLMATQEVARASPAAAEAGVLTVQNEEA
jgi:hypothetical protein